MASNQEVTSFTRKVLQSGPSSITSEDKEKFGEDLCDLILKLTQQKRIGLPITLTNYEKQLFSPFYLSAIEVGLAEKISAPGNEILETSNTSYPKLQSIEIESFKKDLPVEKVDPKVTAFLLSLTLYSFSLYFLTAKTFPQLSLKSFFIYFQVFLTYFILKVLVQR